jgi:hypothetical protein
VVMATNGRYSSQETCHLKRLAYVLVLLAIRQRICTRMATSTAVYTTTQFFVGSFALVWIEVVYENPTAGFFVRKASWAP